MAEENSYKKTLYAYIFVISIAINIVGAEMVTLFKLPAYLDSVGTIFCAILLGPMAGVLVGLLSHLTLAVFLFPAIVYFAPVNALIGAITGYIFQKYPINFKNVVLASIVLAIFASLFGNLISLYVFGGNTGESVDILTKELMNRGLDVVSAIFVTGFVSNLIDKIISFVIVFIIIGLFGKYFESDLKINWDNKD